jgi:hypothetical protein
MTSIEWLRNELWEQFNFSFSDNIFEQSKEMHKAEHGKTWDSALDKYEVRAGNYMRAYEDFDDYYEETFKQPKKD